MFAFTTRDISSTRMLHDMVQMWVYTHAHIQVYRWVYTQIHTHCIHTATGIQTGVHTYILAYTHTDWRTHIQTAVHTSWIVVSK